MKDINLKPGTFSETLENASGKGPGKSLVKFILGVLSSTLAYDTTLNKVHVYNGSAWVALH